MKKLTSKELHRLVKGTFFLDDGSKFPLAPCPFCGEGAELSGSVGKYQVSCANADDGDSKCYVSPNTEYFSSPEEAAKNWNARPEKSKKWIIELRDKLQTFGTMTHLRSEFYSLCIELGLYEEADSVCRLFYFPDTHQVIAAHSLEQILQDQNFAEFHDRIRWGECLMLSWDARLRGLDSNKRERDYAPCDLVPCETLPELVFG